MFVSQMAGGRWTRSAKARAETAEPRRLSRLPPDAFRCALHWLEARDLARVEAVCRVWRALPKDHIWRLWYVRDWAPRAARPLD